MQLDEKYLISLHAMEVIKDGHALQERLDKGQTYQQILEFSDDAILGFYAAAQELLNQKRYGDASDAFFFLSQLAPQVKAFWLGMARSERLNHRIEEAIGLYLCVIAMEEADKSVYMECVRCCLSVGKTEEALQILDMALGYAAEHSDDIASKDLHDASIECKEWILEQKNS